MKWLSYWFLIISVTLNAQTITLVEASTGIVPT